MESEAIARQEAKTRDGIFLDTLMHDFELPPRTAQSIVETAKSIYRLEQFDADRLCEAGKTVRHVISIKAKHGPRLKELPMVSVTLTLDAGKEDQEVFREHGSKSLRQTRIVRVADEALEQGGVLTQEDLADLLHADIRTIRRDIRELLEREVRVPTRGLYHDIGPTVSHKVRIVELYLEYRTYSEISRLTRHFTASIQRYLQDFCRVARCHRQGIPLSEIGHIVGLSQRLARDYAELYLRSKTPEREERLADMLGPLPGKKGAQVS
ncbi:MAG: DUF1670 domain-containing protein [Firmicutes bacterium]|nr:DUF1670 domain-containing protein [Bacillota bacterium]